MKARVYVSMKPSVLDPQGQTICSALQGMGHREMSAVRQGKYFEIGFPDQAREKALALLDEVARDVLSNPVIEDYRVEILEWIFCLNHLCAELSVISAAAKRFRSSSMVCGGSNTADMILLALRCFPMPALLEIRRASGKLRNLEEVIRNKPMTGIYGIGHTRWATHGRPTEENAHPHRDCKGQIVVVHNGIVENYLALRKQLTAEGHNFVTETDTEVIAHLVEKYLNGSLEDAVRARD